MSRGAHVPTSGAAGVLQYSFTPFPLDQFFLAPCPAASLARQQCLECGIGHLGKLSEPGSCRWLVKELLLLAELPQS